MAVVNESWMESGACRGPASNLFYAPSLGERREVRWQLDARDLSFVDRDGVRQVMPGSYRVSVGGGQPGTGAPGESAAFTLARPVLLPR